jgi:hypothetical protein
MTQRENPLRVEMDLFRENKQDFTFLSNDHILSEILKSNQTRIKLKSRKRSYRLSSNLKPQFSLT